MAGTKRSRAALALARHAPVRVDGGGRRAAVGPRHPLGPRPPLRVRRPRPTPGAPPSPCSRCSPPPSSWPGASTGVYVGRSSSAPSRRSGASCAPAGSPPGRCSWSTSSGTSCRCRWSCSPPSPRSSAPPPSATPGASSSTTAAAPATTPPPPSSSAPARPAPRPSRALLANPDSPYLPVALLDDDPRKRNLASRACRCWAAVSAIGRVAAETGRHRPAHRHPVGRRRARRASSPTAPSTPASRCASSRRWPSCSAAPSASATSAPSPPRTSSAATRSTPTSTPSPATSPASGCSSPAPAARSAPSCAARSTASRPSELIMLDRDESALHAVQLSIDGRACSTPPTSSSPTSATATASRRSSSGCGPRWCSTPPPSSTSRCWSEHPGEALKTNVWGTQTVLEVAADHGVERFVNISTDKAADPTSVLGYSKRIAERLTAHAAASSPRRRRYHGCRCGSATCSAAGARCSPPSRPRSPPAARSPSPTPTSPATS